MIDGPGIEVRAEQPYVAIPIQVTFREWGQANALVPQVYGWLAANNIIPAGPPFFRYHVIGSMDEKFHLEIGVPVGNPVEGDGRIVAGAIPAGSYATLVHTGHPDKLIHAYTEFEKWIAAQALQVDTHHNGSNDVWAGRFEFYLTNPEEEPDLNKWAIQIAYRLKDQPEASRSDGGQA